MWWRYSRTNGFDIRNICTELSHSKISIAFFFRGTCSLHMHTFNVAFCWYCRMIAVIVCWIIINEQLIVALLFSAEALAMIPFHWKDCYHIAGFSLNSEQNMILNFVNLLMWKAATAILGKKLKSNVKHRSNIQIDTFTDYHIAKPVGDARINLICVPLPQI